MALPQDLKYPTIDFSNYKITPTLAITILKEKQKHIKVMDLSSNVQASWSDLKLSFD